MKDKKTLAISIIVIVLVLAVIFTFGYKLIREWSNSNKGDVISQVPNTSQNEEPDITVDWTLDDYVVYDVEEISFKFALVKVNISSNVALALDLADLTTDESISLGSVDQYLNELAGDGIYLQKLGADFELTSSETAASFTLFVPLINREATSVQLAAPFSSEVLTVDLTKNNTGTKEALGYEEDEVISDEETYQVVVSSALDITGETLYQNGEATTYPATAQLTAFKLKITSLDGSEVKIEEAQYVTAETGDTFLALDSSYGKTEKRSNVINVGVTNTGEGWLFFMTLDPDQTHMSYVGQLKIKINSEWSTIDVNL
ncbi:MAG: hypothetical protein VB012_01435 [Erysipelotrichaceae bacterium]|nr:hypothetical protein [Erysipelotrichaceae bacterium]